MDPRQMLNEEALKQFNTFKDYVTLGSVVNALTSAVVLWVFWPFLSGVFFSDWREKGLVPKHLSISQSVVMSVLSYVSALTATKVTK